MLSLFNCQIQNKAHLLDNFYFLPYHSIRVYFIGNTINIDSCDRYILNFIIVCILIE